MISYGENFHAEILWINKLMVIAMERDNGWKNIITKLSGYP